MKKSTHKRLTAWLLTLALVVTLLPGMGMTALAVEDESTGPPAVTAPTDPVDPIDPVDPVDPFDPVDPVDPTDSVDPVDPIDPVDPEPPKPPEEPEPSGEPLAPPVMKAPMRAASLTAAANGIPGATSVFVDDGKSFYDGAGNQNQLYYKNGDEADKFKGTVDDYNAHYDPDTGVLTLKDYNGGRIGIGGAVKADITIKLVGTNTVTGTIENRNGGDLTITGDGSLTVNNKDGTNGCGIAAGYAASFTTGSVTITGNAKVNVNVTTENSADIYGIFAKENITVSGNASVDIICSTPNRTSNNGNFYGMYVSIASSSGQVTIDTTGEINIDVSAAGNNNPWSCGVSAPSYTLTKVRSMEVQWKGSGGAAIYGTDAFDDATHAVNVDTTNRYASYRFGTPHKVTVTGGYLTGPGVKYERNSGYFLAGDTVKLTAPNRQASSTDTTEIPFDKWVSDDVTITDGSSQTVSFTMPSKDVAVRANYNPFTTDGQPSFKRTNDSAANNSGTISFKLNGSPENTHPALVRENSDKVVYLTDASVTDGERKYNIYNNDTVYGVPPGQYRVRVEYGNYTFYSEPFTVKYAAPAASVDDVTVSGSAGTAISETSVTVTLENDTFASALSGDWIQNLPAGLSQSVTRTNDTTATITITGTPQVGSTEVMQITIPAGALAEESGMPVKVSIGGKAKFAITSNAPTADKIQISDYSSGKFSNEHPYYKNGADGTLGTFSNDPSNYNAHYDPETGTLTLKDYNGPCIRIKGDEGQTVTVKLVGETNNTVKYSRDPAIQLNKGVNLMITSDEPANLTLDATNANGIGALRGVSEDSIGSVTIMGKATVAINVSLSGQSYSGIRGGGNVAVLGDASLKITCSSDGGTIWGYGIYASSGTVTVDTTGTVDIDVSECANSNTYCIYANKIEFKKAEAITLKYVPKSAGWSLSKPTYGTIDASSMKAPTTDPNPVVANQLATVTYAKKGARPAKPTISAYSFTFDQLQEVALTCATPGTVIYYTTDGSDPTTSSTRTQYSESFYVRQSCTLKAVAYSAEDEQYSAVAEAVFTRRPVSITVVGGGKAYSDSARTIEITQAEPGTTVYLKAPAEIDDGAKVFDEWSATASIANKKSCDSASFVMPANPITITAHYKPKPAGVTVSGTALSWNATNDALYYLYPSTMEDAAIRAQWKSGGYTGTACTSKGTPTASGKQFEQTFTFDTVAAGDYKLVVVKPGHGLWIEELTVNTDNITDKSVQLYKMGDVNRDGKVNSTDALWVRQSSAGGRVLDAYQKILADLNRDGKVNSTDALWIRQISAGSRTLTY